MCTKRRRLCCAYLQLEKMSSHNKGQKGRFFKVFFAAFFIFGYFFRENCRKAQLLGILVRCFCLYYRKLY